MLLTGIIVGIAYMALSVSMKFSRIHQRTSDYLTEYYLFSRIIQQDFIEADVLKSVDNSIRCYKDEQEVRYTFVSDFLILRQDKNKLVDTFHIAHHIADRHKLPAKLPGEGYIYQLDLNIAWKEDTIPMKIFKLYDNSTLLNLQ